MEKLFDDAAPNLAKTPEGIQIKKLIREILQYDPAKRPTVAQFLQDPRFVRNDWGSEGLDDPGYEDDDRKESDYAKQKKEKEKDDDSSKLGDSDNSEHAEEDVAYDYEADEYDEDDIKIILNKSQKGKGKRR